MPKNQRVIIDSQFRDNLSEASNNYIKTLQVRIFRNSMVSLKYFTMARSWYAVEAGVNDKIYFSTVTDGPLVATIPAQNYTLTQLRDAISTAMNLVATPAITVTSNNQTNKLRFQCGENITFTFFSVVQAIIAANGNPASAARVMGGNRAADGTPSTDQILPNMVDLRGFRYFYVRLTYLDNINATSDKAIGQAGNYDFLIPSVREDALGTNTFAQNDSFEQIESYRENVDVTKVQIQLLQEDGRTPLPTNGIDHFIIFNFVSRGT